MNRIARSVCLWALASAIATLFGCKGVGPSALGNGRAAYNAVINATEDQQILSMIVRQRYDDTFGMLAVSSVSANLRVGGSVGGNVGIGPDSSFEGNLVPFSAQATYEDNPTITYQPMRGEQFIERMLAPLTAEQMLLLSRMSNEQVETLHLFVRRVNGITNPRYSTRPASDQSFARFVDLFVQLREAGELDIVQTPDAGYQLVIHDNSGDDQATVDALLHALGVQAARDARGMITLPVSFGVGAHRTDALDIETPSALEVIKAVGAGVSVPADHVSEGLARSLEPPPPAVLDVRSSKQRPAHAAVAVMHNNWWFYIDSRDSRSKQSFMILRTLIGLRLDQGAPTQAAPILTLPVAR